LTFSLLRKFDALAWLHFFHSFDKKIELSRFEDSPKDLFRPGKVSEQHDSATDPPPDASLWNVDALKGKKKPNHELVKSFACSEVRLF